MPHWQEADPYPNPQGVHDRSFPGIHDQAHSEPQMECREGYGEGAEGGPGDTKRVVRGHSAYEAWVPLVEVERDQVAAEEGQGAGGACQVACEDHQEGSDYLQQEGAHSRHLEVAYDFPLALAVATDRGGTRQRHGENSQG